MHASPIKMGSSLAKKFSISIVLLALNSLAIHGCHIPGHFGAAICLKEKRLFSMRGKVCALELCSTFNSPFGSLFVTRQPDALREDLNEDPKVRTKARYSLNKRLNPGVYWLAKWCGADNGNRCRISHQVLIGKDGAIFGTSTRLGDGSVFNLKSDGSFSINCKPAQRLPSMVKKRRLWILKQDGQTRRVRKKVCIANCPNGAKKPVFDTRMVKSKKCVKNCAQLKSRPQSPKRVCVKNCPHGKIVKTDEPVVSGKICVKNCPKGRTVYTKHKITKHKRVCVKYCSGETYNVQAFKTIQERYCAANCSGKKRVCITSYQRNAVFFEEMDAKHLFQKRRGGWSDGPSCWPQNAGLSPGQAKAQCKTCYKHFRAWRTINVAKVYKTRPKRVGYFIKRPHAKQFKNVPYIVIQKRKKIIPPVYRTKYLYPKNGSVILEPAIFKVIKPKKLPPAPKPVFVTATVKKMVKTYIKLKPKFKMEWVDEIVNEKPWKQRVIGYNDFYFSCHCDSYIISTITNGFGQVVNIETEKEKLNRLETAGEKRLDSRVYGCSSRFKRPGCGMCTNLPRESYVFPVVPTDNQFSCEMGSSCRVCARNRTPSWMNSSNTRTSSLQKSFSWMAENAPKFGWMKSTASTGTKEVTKIRAQHSIASQEDLNWLVDEMDDIFDGAGSLQGKDDIFQDLFGESEEKTDGIFS